MQNDTKTDSAKTITFLTSDNKAKPYNLDATAPAVFGFSSAVFGKAFELGEGYSLAPGFLESWRWDFKEKYYELKIKSGVKFHNGREVEAKDVEFMLLKGFFTPVRLATTAMLANIEGVEVVKSGTPFKSGLVSGVKIVDSKTLRIKLKAPNPSFLYTIARPVPSLVPPEEMAEDLIAFKNLPVGSGPYKVVYSDPDSSLVRLEIVDQKAFPKAPKYIQLVADSKFPEIDLAVGTSTTNPPFKGAVRTVGGKELGTGIISFNYGSKLGRNPKFRQGISLALDRSRIVDGIDSFKDNQELLPKGFWGRLTPKQSRNVPEATRLIKEALQEAGVISLKGYIGGPLWVGKPLDRLMEQLKEVGVDATFEPLKKGEYTFQPDDTQFPFMVYGVPADFVDPLNMFAHFLPNGPKPLEAPEKSAAYVEAYEKASKAESLDVRAETMKQVSAEFLRENIAVPVFSAYPVLWVSHQKIDSLGNQDAGFTVLLERIKMK